MNPIGRRRRHPLVALSVSAAFTLSLLGACIGERPSACFSSNECPSGTTCMDDGFCDKECSIPADCPCGSTCVTSCGMCLRLDLAGPATCFAYLRGMDTDEVLGACGVRERDAGTATSPEDAGAERGACTAQLTSLPMCNESPPRATVDAGEDAVDAEATADGDTNADAGEGDAEP